MHPSILCVVSAVGLLVAGCSPPPGLRISEGGRDLEGQTVDFGSVALSRSASRTFTLTNIGEAEVTLSGVTVDAPFSVGGGSTCTDGLRLPVGSGACTLTVVFTPREEGASVSGLEARYRERGDERSVSGWVRGAGILDCSIAADLSASRAAGVKAAEEENASQTARGDAAGRALAYDDGHRAGYATAYDDGRRRGYDDPLLGYPAAYASAYASGKQRGAADPRACNDGSSQGASVGYADGVRGGEIDGYDAGYQAGYQIGYARGVDDCAGGAWGPSSARTRGRPAPLPLPPSEPGTSVEQESDPAFVAACREQGYRATHQTDAHQRAYDAAAAQNAEYQRGLAAGDESGGSDGVRDGRAQGATDGARAGNDDGYAAGAKAAYDGCFDGAYQGGYTSGYNAGYDGPGGFPAGGSAGDYDGYNAGFYSACPS